MIIWVILFGFIIVASLILALRSMRDYASMPIHSDTVYSLYLVKNEAGLNKEILEKIDKIINQKRLIVSFERLYKGSKKALVVYGPTVILKQFITQLDLVELEDYSVKYGDTIPKGVLAWEISSKDFRKEDKPLEYEGKDDPILGLKEVSADLSDSEELWWQVVTQPKCERDGLQILFKTLIRVVVITGDDGKARMIKSEIDEKVKNTNLVTVPQAFSTIQILKHYQKRALPQNTLNKEGGHFVVTIEDIKDLLN
ncbi:MAG: hypothetical protein WCV81_03855 [Microgenomates group bacterium]|jgi:hypothetical protein